MGTPNRIEALTLAAEAAGYVFGVDYDEHVTGPYVLEDGFPVPWDPEEDDAACINLAADAEIDVMFRVVGGPRVEALAPGGPLQAVPVEGGQRMKAVRRAVFLAAVEMGRKKRRLSGKTSRRP